MDFDTWVVEDDGERRNYPTLPGYELRRLIGAGGFTEVYVARQRSVDRDVAICTPRPQYSTTSFAAEALRREARCLALLQHPHVVSVIDLLTVGDRPYLVLEYASEGSVSDKLQNGPQRPELAASLIEHLARIMHWIHSRGIIHTNLKPSQILFTSPADDRLGDRRRRACHESEFGIPMVSGFGLAIDAELRSKIEEGEIAGTMSYMAPEHLANGRRELGPPADVYSLGAIMYLMLTGVRPLSVLKGESVRTLAARILEQAPASVRSLTPDVDARLDDICLKCLAKRPEDRYATAGELAEDLGDYLGRLR